MKTSKNFQTALKHYQEGNSEKALAICNDIIKIEPRNVDVIHLLAILHYQIQDYDIAVGYIRKGLQIDQNDFYAFFLLGNIFHEQGRFEEAIIHLQKAAELNPSLADAHFNLAIIFERTDQFEKALVSYKKALSLNPNLADVQNNLGNLLLKMNHVDEAILYLRKAVQLDPNYVLAFNNLGLALKEKRTFDEAIIYLLKAIEIDPSFADAYRNLAVILKEKGRADEAMTYLRKAIELNPSFADAYCNLAIIFEESGRLDEALAFYRKALEISPNDAEIHWNMSLTFLSSGDFKQGWKEYEWRLSVKDFKQRTFPIPRWHGSSLRGKSLFIHAEQGVGEEIMFASCLPEVMTRADSCIVECDVRLVPLFSRSFPRAKMIERVAAGDLDSFQLPQPDMKIAIGSLPFFLRPNLSSFPQHRAYLIPDSLKVEVWRTRFKALEKDLKVGISWRGGGKASEKRLRSTVLEQWKSLFSVKGVNFINLQYGDCSNELQETREKSGITIHDWDDADPLKDLDNFAAEISAIDLVISVDNATVHMAGALGVPVWVLLPFACDWRWMQDFEDTPWYKSVRLIRQRMPADWEGVFERAASTLKQYIETGILPGIDRRNSYKSHADKQ